MNKRSSDNLKIPMAPGKNGAEIMNYIGHMSPVI